MRGRVQKKKGGTKKEACLKVKRYSNPKLLIEKLSKGKLNELRKQLSQGVAFGGGTWSKLRKGVQ